MRQLDFQDKRDKERDNTIVPLSPERKQIVESLMQVNEKLKSIQNRNNFEPYSDVEKNTSSSSSSSSNRNRGYSEKDNSYSYSTSQSQRNGYVNYTNSDEDRDGDDKYGNTTKDDLDRLNMRHNYKKENAVKLVWEIDDPDLYTLSDSDDDAVR